MFNMMRIRAKLALALVIPLLTLLGLSGFVVALSAQQADDASQRARAIEDQVALATSAIGPQGVLGALQIERNAEARYLAGALATRTESAGPAEDQAGPDQARIQTDIRAEQFRQTITAAPESVRTIFAPGLRAIDRVAQLRAGIDASTTPRKLGNLTTTETFTAYTDIIATLFDANSKLALAVDDASLRNGATLIDITARDRELGTILTYQLVVTRAASGAAAAVPDNQLNNLQGRERAADELLLRSATGPYAEMAQAAMADERILSYRRSVNAVFAGDTTQILPIIGAPSSEVWSVWTELDQKIGTQLDADANALEAAANQEATDAQNRQRTIVLVSALVLIAAAAITYLASRSISKPLLRLARNAEDMAVIRLPGAVKDILETPLGEDVVVPELAPVPAGGGREINEVAVALNSVQSSATDLAVEQALLRRNIADSFVNLGRRNQTLLSRQIDSITQMEREEADPDNLHRLFALDHLATRMRRNAESLLLLGGLDPHRQWSAPVPLIEIVRGAMGEVEDYQRINIRTLDDALIKGSAAADVTHLVAELLENALRFSPPDREVEILGRVSDGDYALAIVDSGIGMSEEDLERSNRRLQGKESFTVAPSRYLGHYVVGVQAARLGASVRLQNSPGTGVTARITLGDTLADAPSAPEASAPTAPAAPAATAEVVDVPDDRVEAPVPETALVPETAPAAEPVIPRHELVDEPAVERYVPPTPVPVAEAELSVSRGAEELVTPSGYKRRQRGAHVPSTEVTLARGEGLTEPAADVAPVDKADSVRNLLSGLQAGADRARAESTSAASTEEDVRDRS